MACEKLLDNLLSSFNKCTNKPEETFLSAQHRIAEKLVTQTKELYDLSRASGLDLDDGALAELIVESFDDEQVWQEIELQNDPCMKSMLGRVSQLAASKAYYFDLEDDMDGSSANVAEESDHSNMVGVIYNTYGTKLHTTSVYKSNSGINYRYMGSKYGVFVCVFDWVVLQLHPCYVILDATQCHY